MPEIMEALAALGSAPVITSVAIASILPLIIYSITAVKLIQRTSNVRLSDTLVKALSMANIFQYEAQVDECNKALLQALVQYAQSEEEVKLADLIARYAYDTMFAITTGEQRGFLKKSPNTSKLRDAMESWKLRSIAHGSYLRFHAIIDKVLKCLSLRTTFEQQISAHLHKDAINGDNSPFAQLLPVQEGDQESARGIAEARVALIAAGSDSTITHILATLFHVYQDKRLVDRLRKEIQGVNLSQPPKIKELIHGKPRMPLLHAVIRETLRLHQARKTRCDDIKPCRGVVSGGEYESQGCTICREFTFAHLNAAIFGSDAKAWNPDRWLADPALARGMRTHMLVFGVAANQCPGKDLHISIITKLLTQIIPFFDFEMAAVNTVSSPQVTDFVEVIMNVPVKIRLPKDLASHAPLIISKPLNAAIMAFAPEVTTAPELPPGFTPIKASFDSNLFSDGSSSPLAKYITNLDVVKEIVPSPTTTGGKVEAEANATAHGVIDSATTSNGTRDVSPAPSSVSKASSDSTPASWSDAGILKGLLGATDAGLLLSRFDPSQDIQARPVIKTAPIHNKTKRFEVHKALECIWGHRLEHNTDTRTNCMYIKKPGTFPPKSRQQNGNKRTTHYGKYNTKPVTAPRPSPVQVNSEWGDFANHNAVIDAAINKPLTADETIAACAKHAAERAEAKKALERDSEDFELTGICRITNRGKFDAGNAASNTVSVNEKAQAEPKAAVIPPHLRRRSVTPPHLRRAQAAAANAIGSTSN